MLKLSYALNHELGADAADFRAVNLALHAGNAVLVFVLARQFATDLAGADAAGAARIATVTALVFALHPVQTESVTYVSGRSNLLMAAGVLLALALWLRGQRPGAGRHLQWLAVPAFLAALASKETAAVLPLAMLLILAARGQAGWRATALPLVLLVTGALLLAAAWPMLPYDYLLRTSLETRSPWQNLLAQTGGLTWLVGQLLRWDRLNADPMLPAITTLTPATLLAGAAWLGLSALGLYWLRRRPALAFGILWFLLWLAPTNSLLARLDLANDRQLYLALLGPAWLLGIALARPGREPRAPWPTLRLPMIALLAAALALGTLHRNRVYATELSFWTDVTIKSPHNSRAWNNLGLALAANCGHTAAALAFGEALNRDRRNWRAEVNLALLERGELPALPPGCR